MNTQYIIGELERNKVVLKSIVEILTRKFMGGNLLRKNGVYWKCFVIYTMKNGKTFVQE